MKLCDKMLCMTMFCLFLALGCAASAVAADVDRSDFYRTLVGLEPGAPSSRQTEYGLNLLRQLVREGDVHAMVALGDCARLGIGMVPNAREAAKWYRRAAAQGSARARHSLAEMSGRSAPSRPAMSDEQWTRGHGAGFQPVPLKRLANYRSLKKKMTDAQFRQAYDAAQRIVTPLADLSREEQMRGIAAALRRMVLDGRVSYTTSAPHYNDAYGYLVLGVASCAGATRTVGLCLNILGIPYEHVNENQWSHQWCRVRLNGAYWICDAFVHYCGPEPAPYRHPGV